MSNTETFSTSPGYLYTDKGVRKCLGLFFKLKHEHHSSKWMVWSC